MDISIIAFHLRPRRGPVLHARGPKRFADLLVAQLHLLIGFGLGLGGDRHGVLDLPDDESLRRDPDRHALERSRGTRDPPAGLAVENLGAVELRAAEILDEPLAFEEEGGQVGRESLRRPGRRRERDVVAGHGRIPYGSARVRVRAGARIPRGAAPFDAVGCGPRDAIAVRTGEPHGEA